MRLPFLTDVNPFFSHPLWMPSLTDTPTGVVQQNLRMGGPRRIFQRQESAKAEGRRSEPAPTAEATQATTTLLAEPSIRGEEAKQRAETKAEEPVPPAGQVEWMITCHQTLLEKYGQDGIARIEEILVSLSERVQRSQRISVRLIYADQVESLRPYGIPPAKPGKAETFKRVIDLLCESEKRDDNQSHVLLIGGDDIIPFFRWADSDGGTLLTDAPYAAEGNQIFMPVRSVGRIPDTPARDITYLIGLLDNVADAHERAFTGHTFGYWLRNILPISHGGIRPMAAFGFTASLWKEAAREVFRVIGDSNEMRVSPPAGRAEYPGTDSEPTMMYFALGGSRDASGWYGHEDTALSTVENPHPAAIYPEDLIPSETPNAIVFSEASFAGDMTGKPPRRSMTLQFLERQATTVVTSTTRVFGALAPPLMGADLLARYFWEALGDGHRTGVALTRAKNRFVRDILALQGYLDPEDQKTLLGFHLFGDPSLLPIQPIQTRERSVHDLLEGSVQPTAHCQLRSVQQPLSRIPLDVQRCALEYASSHLPHMEEASLVVARPILCDEECQAGCSGAAGDKHRMMHPGRVGLNYIFTLSQTTADSEGKPVKSIAKITVSPRGEVLKALLSR